MTWLTIYEETFNNEAALGKVLEVYSTKIAAYPTGMKTSKPWETGTYSTEILEVKNGRLIINIGASLVAAIRPVLPEGLTAGRFTVKMKADELPGYKIAYLLWPDSKNWPYDGEIDFPEQPLLQSSVVHGFVHLQDAILGNDQFSAKGKTGVCDGNWHTYTIQWEKDYCSFTEDGVLLKETNVRVPVGPMHWVLQAEPYLFTWKPPDPLVKGRIMIEFIKVEQKV